MSQQSVVGVYDSMSKAEEAVRLLDQGHFPIRQVSVVARNLESENRVHGYVTACDVSKQGAWVGGIFGLLVGAAFVWVPGFGPLLVAGSLSAVLLGGLEGAPAGAAGGGLLGWGISKQHILKYERAVKAGKYLVIAHGSAEEVTKARRLLDTAQAGELEVHGVPRAAVSS